MKYCIFLVMMVALSANPILVSTINEFQVAPYDSERVELRYLETFTEDTVFIGTIPMYNKIISTPAGIASIDTNIFLINMGQLVIDRSVLTGSFGLPDDSGFIFVVEFDDSLTYPGPVHVWQHAPAAPVFWSAAKFHYYLLDFTGYNLIADWYIDSTPTFGSPNDDYPGCYLSGCVYCLSNQPLAGACVTALFAEYAIWTFPSLPYYNCCTTFTHADGSYSFDSLLPYFYDVNVSVNGYIPDTQYFVGPVFNTTPVTNVDFFLQPGITENQKDEVLTGTFLRPNPFRTVLQITMHDPVEYIDMYDVTGKLMRRVDNVNLSSDLSVDCVDLPRGIYFVALREQKLKVIKL